MAAVLDWEEFLIGVQQVLGYKEGVGKRRSE